MSNILLISYYFPPVGGAGAQRPVKFAHYLRQLGRTTVVLTGSGATGGLWTPSDPTLGLDVPPETKVIRVQGPEPHSSGGFRTRAARLARRQSDWSRWWRNGIVAAGASLDNIDVIYTIMSPYTSAEASLALSKKLGVGWIADLGDPWALDEMMVYPTGLHRRLEIARMRRLLGTAAAIVMSTPEAAYQLVQEFPELAARRVVSITNGYDAADFADVPLAATDPMKFRIVHTGYLHTELGLQERQRRTMRRILGGATPGVDILTRSHVYLLEAVDRLLERDPSLGQRLEVHFAGVLSETDRRLAARSPVTVLHGYLSHADSIALMRSADLLFLPMQNLSGGRRSTTVPGKTYEYLASGRPILGAVPAGDARDILTRIGHAVCDPDDTTAIAETIATAMSDRNETQPNDTLGAQFAYDTLARDAASVIDAVSCPEVRPAAAAARYRPAAQPEHELNVLLLAYHFPPIGGAGARRR